MNDKMIQIQGPFEANIELIDKIKNENFSYIKKIGINSETGNRCKLNGQVFEIGKTGILEFNEVKIVSVIFLEREDNNETRTDTTIIDCILE